MTPGVATDDGGMMTRTVLITVSAAAAYLVLVAGLMAWCRYRRIKRKQQYLRTAAEGTSVLREFGVGSWRLICVNFGSELEVDLREFWIGFGGPSA